MENNSDASTEAVLGLNSTKSAGRSKRWIGWSGLILIALVAVFFWYLKAGESIVRYKTQPVIRSNLVVTVTATGSLAATNEVEVGSELSGIIKTMDVDFNDRVKVGQILATLDDTKFKAAVMKSRASLASARAGLQKALATQTEKEKLLTRYHQTRKITGGKMPSLEDLEAAEANLDRAVAEVAIAKATIEEARAKLAEDETDLAKTAIYSPVNGIVLERSADPGQTVAASLQAPVLFILAEDLTRMELQVDVDEADVGLVKEGQEAQFSVDAYPDRMFRAKVTQVRYGSQTTEDVVTYKTIMKVDNPDLLLRPGMTATADITVEKLDNALLIPNAALRFTLTTEQKKRHRGLFGMLIPQRHRKNDQPNPDRKTNGRQKRIWVLKEGEPMPIDVTTGPTNGSFTAVIDSQLQPGQELILDTLNTTQ